MDRPEEQTLEVLKSAMRGCGFLIPQQGHDTIKCGDSYFDLCVTCQDAAFKSLNRLFREPMVTSEAGCYHSEKMTVVCSARHHRPCEARAPVRILSAPAEPDGEVPTNVHALVQESIQRTGHFEQREESTSYPHDRWECVRWLWEDRQRCVARIEELEAAAAHDRHVVATLTQRLRDAIYTPAFPSHD